MKVGEKNRWKRGMVSTPPLHIVYEKWVQKSLALFCATQYIKIKESWQLCMLEEEYPAEEETILQDHDVPIVSQLVMKSFHRKLVYSWIIFNSPENFDNIENIDVAYTFRGDSLKFINERQYWQSLKMKNLLIEVCGIISSDL